MSKLTEQRLCVYLIPNKIVFSPMNQKDQGTWYPTEQVKVIELPISNIELGDLIIKYLEMTIYSDISYDTIRQNWKNLIKVARFKTEKEFMKNARRLTIVKKDKNLQFEPYQTSISKKTFLRVPSKINTIDVSSSKELLGNFLLTSLEDCSFVE